MSRTVTIKQGVGIVALPNGRSYTPGQTAVLTDDQYLDLTPGALATLIVESAPTVEPDVDARIDLNESQPFTKIPQLEDVAITVYGHSLAALLAPSVHTAGRHWTNMLNETNTGTVTNRAVGGTVMEQQSLYMSLSGSAWVFDANKKLCLVDCVTNSAGQAGTEVNEAAHLKSLKNSVETIAAMACSDYIDEQLPNAQWAYSAGWALQGLAYYLGAQTAYYTTAPNAYAVYTVPPGVVNKRYWAVVLDADYRVSPTNFAPVRIQRNNGGGNTDVGTYALNEVALANPGYTKRAIDCGVYSAGQTIIISHAGTGSQTLFLDGLLVDNGKNHACFFEDNPLMLAENAAEWLLWVGNPGMGKARVERYNTALREQVASFNARVPNGASTIAMRDPSENRVWVSARAADYYNGTDRVHPNDHGNFLEFVRITRELAAKIPWTSRLHSVITHE